MKKVYLEKRCKSDVNLSDSVCEVNLNELHSVNEILENTMELDDIDTLIHLELENYTSNDNNIICLGELMNLHTEYEDRKSSNVLPYDQDFADYYQEDSKLFSIQPKATSGLQKLDYYLNKFVCSFTSWKLISQFETQFLSFSVFSYRGEQKLSWN